MTDVTEIVDVYVDDFAFKVQCQFNNSYLPSSEAAKFDIVSLHSWDAETEEEVDITNWLKVQFSDFNDKLEKNTLEIVDCEWLESMQSDFID